VRNALQAASPSADEIDDQYDQRNNEKNVDQSTGNMEAESQQPQDQENDKNCPEHRYSSDASLGAREETSDSCVRERLVVIPSWKQQPGP